MRGIEIRLAVGQGRVKIFFNHLLLIHKSILCFLLFHYLIYQVYPARARAAPGGSRRQSCSPDRGSMFASLLFRVFFVFLRFFFVFQNF